MDEEGEELGGHEVRVRRLLDDDVDDVVQAEVAALAHEGLRAAVEALGAEDRVLELEHIGGDVPARHGPAGIEPLSGDVIGFVVTSSNRDSRPVYISGDTTWFDGVAEVARHFKCGVVLPFAGAAQTRGPFHLTMDTNDTIETARAFPDAVIVPVHTEGWAHFRQSGEDLRKTFDVLGLGPRLRLLEPGVPTVIEAP